MSAPRRVLVLTADLLFGSRVQGQLSSAGYEVELLGDAERVRARLSGDEPARPAGGQAERLSDDERERLASDEAARPAALVVDLTDEDLGGAALVASLNAGAGGTGGCAPTLGFYSHVDVRARERAERAGFDVVVPRSRMAREGAELVARLTLGQAP